MITLMVIDRDFVSIALNIIIEKPFLIYGCHFASGCCSGC